MKERNDQMDLRIAILGAPRVGKSAITVRFLTKRFIGEYEPEMEFIYRRHVRFEDEVMTYELKDSSGRTCLANPKSYFLWSSTVVVVYSIIDRSSFVTATVILEEARGMAGRSTSTLFNSSMPALAIFANKHDLCHRREVSIEEGRNLALKYGASFYEISAATDYDNVFVPMNTLIMQAFMNMTKLAIAKQQHEQQQQQLLSPAMRPASLPLPLIEENALFDEKSTTTTQKKSPHERKQSVRRKLSAAIFKKRSETM